MTLNERLVFKCLEQRDVLDLPNPHFDIVGHENTIAATKCDTPRLPGVGKRPLGLYPDGELTIRRSLSDCEGKLDRSIFFRASRRYIVNLSHVKRLHFENGGIVFVLNDGRKVALSRRQGIVFRRTRTL